MLSQETLEKLEVLQIFGPPGEPFVLDDVFQSNKGDPVNHLGSVDQHIYIAVADRPSSSELDGAIEACHDVDAVLLEMRQLAQRASSLPRAAATKDIQIVRRWDDTPNNERTTAKNRIVAGWKLE